MELFGWPQNGSYFKVPPLTNGRPSYSTTMPLQNMSHGCDCVTTIFSLTGSRTAYLKFVSAATLPDPDTIRTLPLFMSAAWTGLMGIKVPNVLHCLCVPACACR